MGADTSRSFQGSPHMHGPHCLRRAPSHAQPGPNKHRDAADEYAESIKDDWGGCKNEDLAVVHSMASTGFSQLSAERLGPFLRRVILESYAVDKGLHGAYTERKVSRDSKLRKRNTDSFTYRESPLSHFNCHICPRACTDPQQLQIYH